VEALARLEDREIQFSALTIGEITKGIVVLEYGPQRLRLQTWLADIERDYADQILPVDREVARIWGETSARLRRIGITIEVADGLIAATAAYYALPLMTRNVRHFQQTGVQIINPWED
jgi:hypothetical protein